MILWIITWLCTKRSYINDYETYTNVDILQQEMQRKKKEQKKEKKKERERQWKEVREREREGGRNGKKERQ